MSPRSPDATVLGLTVGPVALSPTDVLAELFDQIPGVDVASGLSAIDSTIVLQLRLPRVVLGLLVGAMLSGAGASYQGVFRNPLADPYLFGVAAGAGLGATLAIVGGGRHGGRAHRSGAPGGLRRCARGRAGSPTPSGSAGTGGRRASTLILAGVAVASFLTAVQTYVQQQNSDSIREVYSWILGRLGRPPGGTRSCSCCRTRR